ncbi:MAG TPA: V-type ATP synthase subunit F, partial [Candidatus Tripitaka californicus]|uniref:V-type ATP synthase subunit F n=1 Tax=Candidatus Tripitaka californicus TaxID=3367616 RepID=UPI0040296B29
MLKILAIVEPEVARGLRLSGVETRIAHSPTQVQDCLMETLRTKGCGIVIVDKAHVDSFNEGTKRLIEESSVPLVVPLPLNMKRRKDRDKASATSGP